jgi:hypothetical protein
LHTAYLVAGIPIADEVPVNGKKILAMFDVLGINGVEIGFAKGQVMNGVEQVGLAGAVVTRKAVDLG